jgi:hypothetical protein
MLAGTASAAPDSAISQESLYRLPGDVVLVNKSIDIGRYREVLLVKVDQDPGEFTNYFRATMREFGFFKAVYDEKTFRNVLTFHHPGKGEQFTATMQGIKLASELHGPFLAARLDWEDRVYLHQTARISVYEAASGTLLFQAEHQTTSWSDLEEALFSPLLNAFHDWLQSNARAQAAPTDPYLE